MMKTLQYIDNTSISSLKHRKLNSNNKSGHRGVAYNKFKKKWEAYIKLRYKHIYLGAFDTIEEAIQARLDGENKYYKPVIEKYENEGIEESVVGK